MATLVLTAAATALTASSPFWIAAAATMAATAVGAVIDRGLFSSTVHREGSRLADLQVQSSNEGTPLPEMAGRMRLAGQVIWATRFREVATTESSGGGKGGSGGGGGTSVTTYSYYANFAVALCEGPVDRLWRVWADGKPLDLTGLIWRFHAGHDDQAPDPLIEGIEGTGRVPAYRGTAYVVFENLPLERFGNRLPQLTFELFRRVPPLEGGGLEDRIKAVTLIPGSGEFVYETNVITAGAGDAAAGTLEPQNRSASDPRADILPALDDLAASLPGVTRVFLVVGWFGDDLRAGRCRIRPRAEIAVKNSFDGRVPVAWRVHGQGREAVPIVSINPANGRIAYGGTPSDDSVVRVIRELKRRGYAVTVYPFVFMDIPAANDLPDPYSPSGAAIGQPAHPWRGRITTAVAPGFDGTTDGTAAVAAEIATFVGTVTPGQIGATVHGDNAVSIGYSSADEWSYRRFILHYARLVQAVNAVDPGAVDAFVIGSELRGLSILRDATGAFPFVAHLRAMAADCRVVMGAGVKLTYAADWSEYFGYQPADGSGDLYYHLDPLWADAHIDAVGIDNYLPLSDWRDGDDHLDRAAGWPGIYDAAYLRANIEGGEQYDWYYASAADRESQIRSPITDGAYGKPWVFRPKDLRAWWSNLHVERIAGVEREEPTAWVPEGKPIWFTELGIPSIDRGTNQPNVFFDPKSSESALPHFSAGTRDDLVQRAGLEAWLAHYGPEAVSNPASVVYGGPMVAEIAVWTWDARPFPAWPAREDLWGDADLWPIGHWLNGKVACADLAGLVHGLCAKVGLSGEMVDVSRLRGVVPGYLRDRPSTPRAEIEALMQGHDFDAAEIGGRLCFLPRGGEVVASLTPGDLVAAGDGEADFALTRAQETDLPAEVAVSFTDVARDYRQSTAVSRRLVGGAAGRDGVALPLAMDEEQALATAERLLAEAWVGREGARFALPPSALALDPGDVVSLTIGDTPLLLRLGRVTDEAARTIEATAIEPGQHRPALAGGRPRSISSLPAPAGLALLLLDLPLIDDEAVDHRPWVAVAMSPATPVALTASATGDSFTRVAMLDVAATIGVTTYPFYNGPTTFWDEGNVLGVELFGGVLAGRPRTDLLAGNANALALRNEEGEWEIVQFADVTPQGARRFDLRSLLRGRLGTEHAMRAPLAAGAPVVLLNGALRQPELPLSARGAAWIYRYGPAALGADDPSWAEASFVNHARGLRPFCPVHVAGWRDAAGNLTITWVRRTRFDGAWNDGGDVPLNEEAERYEVDILDGGGPAVKRTITTAVPQAFYSATEATADFGWVPSVVALRVHQVSSRYGRGIGADAVL